MKAGAVLSGDDMHELRDMITKTKRGCMTCRYCGYELRTQGHELRSKFGSRCNGSPSGKHAGVSDGSCCVYCGRPAKPINGRLRTSLGPDCPNSPTRAHSLQ